MEDKQLALKEESKEVSVPTPFPVPAENKENKRGASGWLNVLAYPISLISGLLVWRTQVYEESYASHNRKHDFDDISEKHLNINAKVRDNPNLEPSEKLKGINNNIENFNDARDIKFRSMGYKNVFDHHSSISGSAKNNALIAGFTVTGIALGVMLMVANSKNLFGGKSEENKDSGMSK